MKLETMAEISHFKRMPSRRLAVAGAAAEPPSMLQPKLQPWPTLRLNESQLTVAMTKLWDEHISLYRESGHVTERR
jgi:hypothetical protein